MSKIFSTFLFVFCFFSFVYASPANAQDFVYPFTKVANPKCRFSAWNTLGDDCKIDVPRIENADYTKYKDNLIYRRIYSILWGATYNYGWDVGNGGHTGVDFATSEGTPVQAIADGEVVYAALNGAWGNSVVIKHTLADKTVLYSSYNHLNSITVKTGAIKQGTILGGVGATGNAYGNHLHFQIDTTNIFHPYYYSSCAKGISVLDAGNSTKCRDDLQKNTLDPIAFIEKVNSVPHTTHTTQSTVTQTQKETQKAPVINPVTTNMQTRESIISQEIKEFMDNFNISLDYGILWPNRAVGQRTQATFTVTYKRTGKLYGGNFPGNGIEIMYNKSNLTIFPEKIILLEKGVRTFDIIGLKTGANTIDFKLGENTLFTSTLNIYTPKEVLNPTRGKIVASDSTKIGEQKRGAIILKTPYGSDQIAIPFGSRYVLSALSGKVKFCNISSNSNRKCSTRELVQELEFGYDQTNQWVLMFQMIAQDYLPIRLQVKELRSRNTVVKSGLDIVVQNPALLEKNDLYFDSIILSLKKSTLFLKDGYALQNRTVPIKQAREMVENYFGYRFLKAGNNTVKKKEILLQLAQLKNSWNTNKENEYGEMTRGSFAQFLLQSFKFPILTAKSSSFRDDTNNLYKDTIYTLSTQLNFKWRDSFGEKYFQPDKLITTEEACYLFDILENYFNTKNLW